MLNFEEILGFQWDEGNSTKNSIKHNVSIPEIEEGFFTKPLLFADDEAHSETEARWHLLTSARSGRVLLIVFTVRKYLIRVISARDANKKERAIYEKEKKRAGYA